MSEFFQLFDLVGPQRLWVLILKKDEAGGKADLDSLEGSDVIKERPLDHDRQQGMADTGRTNKYLLMLLLKM